MKLGMDATECSDLLIGQSNDKNLAIVKDILGHTSGKTPEGLCGIPSEGKDVITSSDLLLGGTRLRSNTCLKFCQMGETRKDGSCFDKLKEYCVNQPDETCNEPVCNCWLPKETYANIRKKSYDLIGGEDSEIAVQIKRTVDQNKVQDNCWWAPCHDSKNGPMDCMGGDLQVCTNINRDLTLSADAVKSIGVLITEESTNANTPMP